MERTAVRSSLDRPLLSNQTRERTKRSERERENGKENSKTDEEAKEKPIEMSGRIEREQRERD